RCRAHCYGVAREDPDSWQEFSKSPSTRAVQSRIDPQSNRGARPVSLTMSSLFAAASIRRRRSGKAFPGVKPPGAEAETRNEGDVPMHGLIKQSHRLRQSPRRRFRNGNRAAALRAFTGAGLYANGLTLACAAMCCGSCTQYVRAAVILRRSEDAVL